MPIFYSTQLSGSSFFFSVQSMIRTLKLLCAFVAARKSKQRKSYDRLSSKPRFSNYRFVLYLHHSIGLIPQKLLSCWVFFEKKTLAPFFYNLNNHFLLSVCFDPSLTNSVELTVFRHITFSSSDHSNKET